MRRRFTWRLKTRELPLGERTLVMGILNVTPDSFSDGGRFLERDHAVGHGLTLLDDGADILDIGGESTRPGASAGEQAAVSTEEELRRIMPVIEDLRRERPLAIFSVDTYKSDVAAAALTAGCEIVNDVSGLRWDEPMRELCAAEQCGVVLMHMRGKPDAWRELPPLPDPVPLVKQELADWALAATDAGIARDHIVLDPGFGFGKSFEENYPLLARFDELQELGFPLLAGTSRKSFVGRLLARDGKDAAPDQRLMGSVTTAVIAVMKGAHIVRVHDVKETAEALRAVDAVLERM
jgi:dihydropteroate synthase